MRHAVPLLLVACGGASPAPLQNSSTAVPKRTPCAKLDELSKLVATSWGAGATVEQCISLVRDGRTVWWLEGHADPPPDTAVATKNALVTESAVLWHGDPEYASGFGYQYGDVEAVDLDGDGNDEALYERTTGEGGMSMTELVVVHFHPAPMAEPLPLENMSNMGDDMCSGRYVIVPGTARAKRLQIERKGDACIPDADTRTYELRSDGIKRI